MSLNLRLLALNFVLLSGCSSLPTQYYSLAPDSGNAPERIRYRVEWLPLQIPEALDRPQLVLGMGRAQLEVREQQRWLVPLSAELRSALIRGVWQQIGAVDSYASGQGSQMTASTLPAFRLSAQLLQLDAELGKQARLQAQWSLKELASDRLWYCAVDLQRTLPDAELNSGVQAYRQLVAGWTEAIADSIEARGQTPACR